MKQLFRRYFIRAALLLVPILIGIGCALGTAAPTDSQPNPTPILEGTLTALEDIVNRLREGNREQLVKFKPVDIKENDGISVIDPGRAELRFRDDLVVELLDETDVQIGQVRLDPVESNVIIRLILAAGHTHAELHEYAKARITVETKYATITATKDGTEFLVCHADEVLTCTVTLEGETEVEAQGKVVTVRRLQGTYIFPNQPPIPPICAKVEEVQQWLDKKRGAAQEKALGELVASWPQEPCAAAGMVRIEGGLYQVGSPQPDEFHMASQEITVAAFWIDQHEVTNAEYKKFLDENETDQQPLAHWLGGTFPPGQENHPVKGVTWDQAAGYCAWANKRLPTEAEWEIAARGPGPEPPLYPWGPDPVAGGQIDDLPLTDTYEVGTKSFNKSPFEVYDMAGNVWEWVGEPYYGPVTDGHKVLRGGRHGLLVDMAYRQQAEPNDGRFVPFAGFRCATDRVEGE